MANEKAKTKKGRPQGRIITRHEVVDLHPVHEPGHFKKSWNLFRNGFATEFQVVFGLPAALLRGEHRRKLEKLVEKEYPRLRKSAARMFIEGALTGDKGPLQTVPVGVQKRLESVLSFLDVLETMVYIAGMDRLMELDKLSIPTWKYRQQGIKVLEGKGAAEKNKEAFNAAQREKAAAKRAEAAAAGESVEETETDESEAGELVDADYEFDSSDLGGLLGEDLGDDPDGDVARVESMVADELDREKLI